MVDPRNPNDPYNASVDPLNPVNPSPSGYRDIDPSGSGTNWGWIIGGVVALFLVFAFVFGFSGSDQTASNDTPMTTGQTTPPAATAPIARSPAVTPPQENTGAAPREPAPAPAPAPAQQ